MKAQLPLDLSVNGSFLEAAKMLATEVFTYFGQDGKKFLMDFVHYRITSENLIRFLPSSLSYDLIFRIQRRRH